MGTVARRSTPITPQEYLELERCSTIKHEYLNGQIFAMSGASFLHNHLASNLVFLLKSQLGTRGCYVVQSDLRVQVTPTGLFTYPDVVVVCAEPSFTDAQFDTLQNPNVIVEVLSPSTEAYDRGDKFSHYRTIESLTDYLMISQNRQRIEHYAKQPDGEWRFRAAEVEGASIHIGSLNVTLNLTDVYALSNVPLVAFEDVAEQEEPPVNGERPT